MRVWLLSVATVAAVFAAIPAGAQATTWSVSPPGPVTIATPTVTEFNGATPPSGFTGSSQSVSFTYSVNFCPKKCNLNVTAATGFANSGASTKPVGELQWSTDGTTWNDLQASVGASSQFWPANNGSGNGCGTTAATPASYCTANAPALRIRSKLAWATYTPATYTTMLVFTLVRQ